jgi:small-conductance mechanosensitive channel/CRP-like cAMP-binding protein
MLGPLLLALALIVVRSLTRNPWIRKRLSLSIFVLLAAWVINRVVENFAPGYTLEGLEKLAMFLALVIAGVVLLFNQVSGDAVSEKFPAIVQDALVIGVFAVVAVLKAPDKLLTTSAVGGLVIGLALQDTLGNLFAGLALQVEKPLFVGDWVRLGSLEGKVKEITWRATKIRTKAGQFCVIPNTLISKDILVNYSNPSPIVRVEKTIGFGYEAHPNLVKKVVLEACADVPDILRTPKPDVLLDAYDDFSINYRCRFWIEDFGLSEIILDRFTTLLYYRLERAGLIIPFPIRDVRVKKPENVKAQLERENKKRSKFVSRLDIFAPLKDAEKADVAACLERIIYAAEETIIRQGEQGDSMFLIDRGQVRIAVEEKGAVHQLAVLGPGQYFGEMALLTGEPRTASAIAVSDCHIFVLEKASFRNVLVDHPEVAESISSVIAERRASLKSKTDELRSFRDIRHETQQSMLGRIRAFFGLG